MDHQAFAQLLGNYGELVGAIAVVATLAYLAIQIRQNTKVARAGTRQTLADAMQRLGSDVVENDDIARIITDGMAGEKLERHEVFRLQCRCFRDLRFFDNALYQCKEGLLTNEEWAGIRMNLALVMQFPEYRGYWDNFQTMFSSEFRDELNAILGSEPSIDVPVAFGLTPQTPRDEQSR